MKTIKAGQQAPMFDLPTQSGERLRLDTLLAQGPVVLFFYPAASSGGCTKEACHFRDLGPDFEAVGAQRVGISVDDVAAQRGFADSHSLGYPLLSDTDGEIAAAYGVKRKYVSPVKRATFVIGSDGTIQDVITSELNFTAHAEKALATLRPAS
ncbi:MAG: peroxiredoxin [Nocardioidaceae bacterium]|nr:peroxiredoxin [Nocardioidaceae bacterium]